MSLVTDGTVSSRSGWLQGALVQKAFVLWARSAQGWFPSALHLDILLLCLLLMLALPLAQTWARPSGWGYQPNYLVFSLGHLQALVPPAQSQLSPNCFRS